MLTDGHATKFDIDVWESKIVKKLTTNANHYSTETLRMAYVNSCMDGEAYKHLAARSRIGTWKPFVTVEKMFEILQKGYGDVNQKHTAMNKFQALKMTKDFNSFWAEFQVLVSELDHNEAILISKLKFKLTLLLSWAMAGGVSWPTNIHEYAKQCQQMYQNLKDIEIRTPVANLAGNWYNQRTNVNTNMNMSMKTAGQQANCNKRSVNSVYSRFSSVVSNLAAMRLARSEATRLTREKIAKLQREDRCFTCKKVSDHWPKCPNKWQPMLVLTNTDSALAQINVSEVTVPQPDYVKAENKWLPQKLLWAVRSHCWSLPLVYQSICLSIRSSWSHIT